jgi:nucleotide-binding universal stress UspA family protein
MKIAVAIRIGEGSKAAVAAGVRLADQLGAELLLLYIASEMEAVGELAAAASQSDAEVRDRMLDEITERCHAEFGNPFPGNARLVVREGKGTSVADQVAAAVHDIGIEMVVVGMKGRSALAKLILGDMTGSILERAPCPVVVIPPAITNQAQ